MIAEFSAHERRDQGKVPGTGCGSQGLSVPESRALFGAGLCWGIPSLLEFHFLFANCVVPFRPDTRFAALVLTCIGCLVSRSQSAAPRFPSVTSAPVPSRPDPYPPLGLSFSPDPEDTGHGAANPPPAALGGPGPDRDLGG